MRGVSVLLVVAGLSVAALFYHFAVEDDGSRSTTRGGRQRPPRIGDLASTEGRPGFLSFAIRVEMAGGDPAAGAQIEYEGPGSGRMKADAGGAAQADGLARGVYTLRARQGGELGTLQFELRETTHLGTLRLAGAVAVHGRVFDASGAALPSAVVEAVPAAAAGGPDMTRLARALGEPDAVTSRATTDAQGSYRLKVASGSRYALRAAAHGYAAQRKPAQRVTAETAVDFHLQPGAAVAGRVLDDRGFPVAGAHVLVVERARVAEGVPKAETQTAADGAFELAVDAPGAPMLVVRASGFAPFFRPALRLPATRLRIELERGLTVRLRVVDEEDPGVTLPGVSVAVDLEGGFATGTADGAGELTLLNLPARRNPDAAGDHVILWGEGYAARVHTITVDIPASGLLDLGELPLGRGGTVHGRVVDRDSGAPVARAVVRSFGGLPASLALAAAPTTLSAGDGSYFLEGVPLEATHVLALHPEYEAPRAGAAPPAGGPLFVAGQTTATRDLVIARAAAVHGIVMRADGEPADGATVRVLDPAARAASVVGGPPHEATTDARGRFALAAGLPAALVATHPEAGDSSEVSVMPGGHGEVVLTLRPPRTLAGPVVDEQEGPVAGVRVSTAARSAVTGTDGAFALRGVAAGPVALRFDHPAYLVVERHVAADAPEQLLGPTVLPRGPGIEGVVVDESGEPVRNVAVRASLRTGEDSDGRPWGEATSDESGRFAIHGLARGSYRLECRGRFAEAADIHTGAKKDGRVIVREAVRLRGRVVCAGEPVAGAQIEARAAAATLGWARSRADGSFVLGVLPPGVRVDLTIRHDGYRAAKRDGVTPSEEPLIELEAGVQVGGTVELPGGAPVPGALVEVLAGGRRARLAQADGRGRFLAGGLPEGDLEVRVLESGLGLLAAEPVPAAAGNTALRVVAARGESITGMVYGPDGGPAARVRVLAVARSGRVVASAWVGRRGSGYALRGLAPGAYTVRAECDKPPARAEVAGVPAGGKGMDLRLEKR